MIIFTVGININKKTLYDQIYNIAFPNFTFGYYASALV